MEPITLDTQLATRSDIMRLENRFDKEIYLLKWMVGVILAGIISLVIKTFFV